MESPSDSMNADIPGSASPSFAHAGASRRVVAIGFANAIGATIIAAMQPVAMRYGATHIDPLLFCAASVIVAAGCVAATMARRGELAEITRREYMPRLFAMSMAGTVATTLALITGLEKISAVAAVILLESEPIYSLLLATAFLRERPSTRQIVATAIILAGIGSVFGAHGAFRPLYAAALIFITPLFWQASHVISLGVMPPLTPRCVTGARYIYAAFVLAAMLAISDRGSVGQLADGRTLAMIGFTGAVIYFLGSLTWYGAISRLSLAWTTAFVIPGVPILSLIFAIIFLGERPNAREAIGIAIAVIGVIALVVGADARRGVSEEAERAEAVHPPLN
jgi:drug/metabolite transporter (DMT)-like permease